MRPLDTPSAGIRRQLLVIAASLLGLVACPGWAVAAETTYSTAWSGGVIAPGDTVVLDDGATVLGNVEANGTLRFNQTTALTMTGTLSGTGSLQLTNSGTLFLTGLNSGTGRLDMAIGVAAGQLSIGSTGSNNLVLGSLGTASLTLTGGHVVNRDAWLGSAVGTAAMARIESGTWANRILSIGSVGSGTLDIAGGSVTNTTGNVGLAGGTGTVTLTSGTWRNAGPLNIGGSVSTPGVGTVTMSGGHMESTQITSIGWSASVGTVTVTSGTFSSAVAIHVGRSGEGTLNVAGGLVTTATGTIGTGTAAVGRATVTSGTLAISGGFVVGGSGAGTLEISGTGGAGGVVVVGGTLSRGAFGTINLQSGGTLQIGTGTTSSGMLSTDLVNDGTVVFNRIGSATMSQSISGTGGLRVIGAGTHTFSGTSSYTGATSVQSGALIVDGALGATSVTVAGGGLLGGAGSIGGPVTVAAGGALAPGASIASLATGAVDLLDGATFAYEVDSASPLAADLLTVAGDLTLSGAVTLSIADLAEQPAPFALGTTLSLVNYTGLWNGGLFWHEGDALLDGERFTAAGQEWAIDYDAHLGGANFAGEHLADGAFVNIMAVPEPSTAAILAAGLLGGGFFVRRRS